jgi:hypothetical protein
MRNFILGVVAGVALTALQSQDTAIILRTALYREGTKPTGSIVFWHMPTIGGTCSADTNSALGKALTEYEGNAQDVSVRVTFERVKPLQKEGIAR